MSQKKDVHRTSGQRSWAIARRIFRGAEFQNKIEALREPHGVPDGGFKDSDELHSWWFWLAANSRHQLSVSRQSQLGKKLSEAEKKAKSGEVFEQQFEDEPICSTPLAQYWKGLDQLRKDLEMSPRWLRGLQTYVLTGDIDKVTLPAGVRVVLGPDPEAPEEITIKVDALTRKEDLEDIWPMIKSLQKSLVNFKRATVQPTFDTVAYKKRRSYELTTIEGKSRRDAAKALNEELHITSIDEFKVGVWKARYKKENNIN